MGGKVILCYSYDSDNVSSNDILYYQIKCYSLYKLYKYSIKYYDAIKSFYDIVSHALLKINKSLDIYDIMIGEEDYNTISLIRILKHFFVGFVKSWS